MPREVKTSNLRSFAVKVQNIPRTVVELQAQQSLENNKPPPPTITEANTILSEQQNTFLFRAIRSLGYGRKAVNKAALD